MSEMPREGGRIPISYFLEVICSFLQQIQSMKEVDKISRKHMSEMKKLSMSEKTRSDNPSSHSTKEHREEQWLAFSGRGMKSLGRKYVQENCFKAKEKEHHEIVISDQVVRNSKLYRMLKQKIQIVDCNFVKQSNELLKVRALVAQETVEVRNHNHNSKLALWELKNQILELKGILNDEEEENKRLDNELNSAEQYEQEEEGQQEMPSQEDEDEGRSPLCLGDNSMGDIQQQEQLELEEECQHLRQEEVDIRMMMMQLHKKMRINPEQERQQEERETGKKQEEEG